MDSENFNPLGYLMTTITKATLGDKASIFIRDVLRENLTDTQSTARTGSDWVFKSMPDKLEIDFPYIIVELTDESTSNLSFNRVKSFPSELTFEILVYADKIADRDVLADEIVSVLRSPSNTDGTDTILSKSLAYMDSTKSNEDAYVSDYPKAIRAKRVTLIMSYGGA